MEIEVEMVPEMTIEEFADKHGLVMRVAERTSPSRPRTKFYASFKNSEVSENGVLIAAYGDGATPEEAIDDYGQKISLRKLAIDAFSSNRTDLAVPRIIKKED